MTPDELEDSVDRVRRRHIWRMAGLFLLFFAVLAGGVGWVNSATRPRTPEWEWWHAIVVAVAFVVAGAGYVLNFQLIKSDCYKLGALCPKCKRHLYTRRHLLFGSRSTLETGSCPHCGHHVFDGSVTV